LYFVQKQGNVGFDAPGSLQIRGIGAHAGVFYHHVGIFEIIDFVPAQNIANGGGGRAPARIIPASRLKLFDGRGKGLFIPEVGYGKLRPPLQQEKGGIQPAAVQAEAHDKDFHSRIIHATVYPCTNGAVNGVAMPQNEISSAVSVLSDLGEPQNFGWSRQPDFFYDPAMAWAPRQNFSESDRYIVFNHSHIFIFEIRDDGYFGSMGITAVSIKEKKRSTQIFKSLLPLGSYEMPSESRSAATRYRRKKLILDFVPMESGARIIKADIRKFGHNRSFRGELVLTEPAAAESLVCNLSWPKDKNAFRYSRRSPWYAVEGVIQFGTKEIVFSGGNAWGIFDWSRGIRPRADIRHWACACGMAGGRLAGFSIGYGMADSSPATENAFFVDGRLHKLDQVTFHLSPANSLSPWRFTSNDGRLEMVFTPQQERTDRRRLLFYSASRRQVCGTFSGKAILDDGAALEFQGMTGFAERCRTRF
jgi:hypothetical protein